LQLPTILEAIWGNIYDQITDVSVLASTLGQGKSHLPKVDSVANMENYIVI